MMLGVTLLHLFMHVEHESTALGFWSLWNWEPSVLLGCAGLAALYVRAVRPLTWGMTLSFCAGVLVLLLALVSPIDTLGDEYLFSAHMLQHLLLILVVPPLLLTGTPAGLLQKTLHWPLIAWLEKLLRQPLTAWLLGTGTLWVWHVPAFYNAALANERVHVVQHLCFLVTAAIFWWPVLSPLQVNRLPPLGVVLYLFAAALASSVLGIYLTFTPPGLYPAYMRPDDAAGILHYIRNGWGISAAGDQQLAGLIMWVPGGLVYLGAILGVLIRWYSAPDLEDESEFPVADGLRVATALSGEES